MHFPANPDDKINIKQLISNSVQTKEQWKYKLSRMKLNNPILTFLTGLCWGLLCHANTIGGKYRLYIYVFLQEVVFYASHQRDITSKSFLLRFYTMHVQIFDQDLTFNKKKSYLHKNRFSNLHNQKLVELLCISWPRNTVFR